MDIASTRALVVGASGVLGAEVARDLCARGARVAVAGRDPRRRSLIAEELGVPGIALDLSEPTSADQAVGEAVAVLGGIDVVVSCVGAVAFGPVTELDDAVMLRLFDANVFGPIRLARAAVPVLAPGGTLVMVSGIVAEQPTAGMAAYSGAKAALTAFDRALARELRRARVRVIDVRPPHLETGLADRPLAGIAPALGPGGDPREAARRIVAAIADDAREVDFGPG
jgi:NAD(P)-dependent dehydrogenase (short-subunit alcohol dehydrogenase family)